jgi:hypothetical protein
VSHGEKYEKGEEKKTCKKFKKNEERWKINRGIRCLKGKKVKRDENKGKTVWRGTVFGLIKRPCVQAKFI